MKRRMRLQPSEHKRGHIHSGQCGDTDARRPAIATRHLRAHRHARGHQPHSQEPKRGTRARHAEPGPSPPRHHQDCDDVHRSTSQPPFSIQEDVTATPIGRLTIDTYVHPDKGSFCGPEVHRTRHTNGRGQATACA
jgi:hypothetical protein